MMYKKIYQDNLLRNILNKSLDAFILVDSKMTVLEWNPNASSLFGWTEDEARGKHINQLIIPRDFEHFHTNDVESPDSYKNPNAHPLLNQRIEVPARHKDGTELPIELTVTPVTVEGQIYFSASIRDLTQRHKDEEELKRRANIINLSRDGLYVVDDSHRITLWNRGAEILYGYSSEEALGQIFYRLLKTDFSEIGDDHSFMGILSDLMKTMSWEGELVQYTKTGEKVHVLSRWTVDLHRKEVLVTNTDITQIKNHAQRVEYLATHDELTGLPNRRLLEDRFHQASALSKRNGKIAGMMLLDLDRFKVVNDSLGHDKGDMLLKEISTRLCMCVRDDDTVARLGGDEFVIILENVDTPADIRKIAKKVISAVEAPIDLGVKQVTVGTSIGITVFPQDGKDIATLLRNADMAMYDAKAQSTGAYRFFNQSMDVEIQKRLLDEHDLRQAVEKQEFELHYQPKICTVTGRTTGVEALIRWNHPVRGMVSPVEFIPLAEEMGLIGKIGEWVIQTACRQAKKWQDDGLSPIQMSVNLSLHQMNDNLVKSISKCLSSAGLHPRWLDIEITESTAMSNVEKTIETLRGIRSLGVSLSIDDFGTGYSSLAYLKKMPLNFLKIDQSFVRGIPYDANDISIVKSIIALAHSMGLKVIAEGVTEREQVAFLDTMKCDYMQGYLFSKPENAETVADGLIDHQWKYPYIRLAS